MENKIPTAEEFLRQRFQAFGSIRSDDLIDFAKLHVEAAQEAAYEKGQICDYIIDMPPIGNSIPKSKRIDKNSILNSYPLDNIK